MTDALTFTLVAIGLYFTADWLLQWLERRRGARFAARQAVFFAIILVLALLSFAVIRSLSGDS